MFDTMTPHSLFPMPPEVTQVILGGGSPIDLDSLHVHSPGEARNFALNYGYDMDVPVQRAAVMRVYEDAVDFLEAVVLEGTNLHVPLEVRDLQDLRARRRLRHQVGSARSKTGRPSPGRPVFLSFP